MFFIENRLACRQAADTLSFWDTTLLLNWMEEQKETPAYPFRVGGDWYCPLCGSPCTEEEEGLVKCTRCERNLSGLITIFVERFPHR